MGFAFGRHNGLAPGSLPTGSQDEKGGWQPLRKLSEEEVGRVGKQRELAPHRPGTGRERESRCVWAARSERGGRGPESPGARVLRRQLQRPAARSAPSSSPPSGLSSGAGLGLRTPFPRAP